MAFMLMRVFIENEYKHRIKRQSVELEKKRTEDARIMAHNQLIQDVFSKLKGVENRLTGNSREDSEQQDP